MWVVNNNIRAPDAGGSPLIVVASMTPLEELLNRRFDVLVAGQFSGPRPALPIPVALQHLAAVERMVPAPLFTVGRGHPLGAWALEHRVIRPARDCLVAPP